MHPWEDRNVWKDLPVKEQLTALQDALETHGIGCLDSRSEILPDLLQRARWEINDLEMEVYFAGCKE